MERMKAQIFRFARGIDLIAAAAIFAMMALTCADVVLRWFRMPIKGTYELVSYLGAITVSFAVAHTLVEKGHVAVNLLVRLLPSRIQGGIEAIIALLSCGLFATLAWQSVLYGLDCQRSGEVSLTLQWPFYPVIYGVAFGAGVVCLVCLIDLAHAITKVRSV